MANRLQWPIRRAVWLTLTLKSGRQLSILVWDWKLTHSQDTQRVTEYRWTYATKERTPFVAIDQIAAVQSAPGPLRWRGWKG